MASRLEVIGFGQSWTMTRTITDRSGAQKITIMLIAYGNLTSLAYKTSDASKYGFFDDPKLKLEAGEKKYTISGTDTCWTFTSGKLEVRTPAGRTLLELEVPSAVFDMLKNNAPALDV